MSLCVCVCVCVSLCVRVCVCVLRICGLAQLKNPPGESQVNLNWAESWMNIQMIQLTSASPPPFDRATRRWRRRRRSGWVEGGVEGSIWKILPMPRDNRPGRYLPWRWSSAGAEVRGAGPGPLTLLIERAMLIKASESPLTHTHTFIKRKRNGRRERERERERKCDVIV